MVSIANLSSLLCAESSLVRVLNSRPASFEQDWALLEGGEFRRLAECRKNPGLPMAHPDHLLHGSGVGEYALQAALRGLDQAFLLVAADYNSAKVEEVLLKTYPWFHLARITLRVCQTESGAALMKDEMASPLRIVLATAVRHQVV